MAAAVYILGALITMACAVSLIRGYLCGRKRLLLWSGVCFLGLTASNFLVFIDLVVVPEIDLYVLRLACAALAMTILLYGLIWDSG